MRVSRLALSDFRSYEELALELPRGRVVFVGANGAGKTNLVEAIRYLSTLSSHRVSTDQPLVRAGRERATIGATIERAGRTLTVDVTIVARGANAARLGGKPARPRDIAGILRTVVFAPEDLDLAKGDPAARRRFIDEVAVALAPPLAGDLADYERVTRQRATLLKTARGRPADLATIDVWDERAADLGARVIRARLDACAALAPYVATAYRALSADRAECAMRYASNDDPDREFPSLGRDDIAVRLLSAMADARSRELERGVCLVGPHRDDIDLAIGGLAVRGYASHGESWSTALALRLGTYRLLTAAGGPDGGEDGEPVLVLDDVFAELDASRRNALADATDTAGQVLITAAVDADVPGLAGGTVFDVGGGEVRRR
jgi:DNA replication and repair protein RecF